MRFLSVRSKAAIPSADTVPELCQNAASSAPASRERPRSVPPALMDARSQPAAARPAAGGLQRSTEGAQPAASRLKYLQLFWENLRWRSGGGGFVATLALLQLFPSRSLDFSWRGGKTLERRITKQPNKQGERRRTPAHPWFLSPGFVTWLNNA